MALSETGASRYRSEDFLCNHISKCMQFYANSLDSSADDAGFFHYFDDKGVVTDLSHRHIVSSTRFVFTNAMAYMEFGKQSYKMAAEHGIRYIRSKHRNAVTGGYCWTLRDGKVEDSTNQCYGVAFVLLAYSKAYSIGIEKTREYMEETWNLLQAHFWEATHGLYRDEADCEWHFTEYRGQNSNMHMCEALLAAYQACKEEKYLTRALLVAHNMTQVQAQKTRTPFVWEHYNHRWEVDWLYNKHDPKHTFRPWGFQSGHQIQWAKLLLLLHQHDPSQKWLKSTAVTLFDRTMDIAWDEERGGVVYGFSPAADEATPHAVCDNDKYFWVQAETIAAAALLARTTGGEHYWQVYEKTWGYVDSHFVDHHHGAWYCVLDYCNRKYSVIKSAAGKTDYHSMGACHDVLAVLRSITPSDRYREDK